METSALGMAVPMEERRRWMRSCTSAMRRPGENSKHLHEDMGTGAAATDLVEAVVVVNVADQLVEDLELGGFFEGGVH